MGKSKNSKKELAAKKAVSNVKKDKERIIESSSTNEKIKLKDVAKVEHKKQGLSEIDDIFATAAKAKKEEKQKLTSIKNNNQQKNNSITNPIKIKCQYDREDATSLQKSQWASDGLGGVFNSEGFTGRRDGSSGYKIYKAHLFNKKGFGNTKDCPFDCQCCFI